jgi:hypothetical protein
MAHVTEMSGDRAQRAYDRLMLAQEAIERQRIGGLKSDIARVQRGDDILTQAQRLMEVHAKVTRMLEVQFVGEVGFGWGVTQGFYTSIGLELQRRSDHVPMWRPSGIEADVVMDDAVKEHDSAAAVRDYLQVKHSCMFGCLVCVFFWCVICVYVVSCWRGIEADVVVGTPVKNTILAAAVRDHSHMMHSCCVGNKGCCCVCGMCVCVCVYPHGHTQTWG